jgi:ABC-2 type transport system ATP-binding protein
VAIIDRGRVLASGRVADIEQRLRQGAVMRVRVLGDDAAGDRAAVFYREQPEVATVERLPDGQLELALRGDDEAAAGLLARTVAAGHRVASFGRAASDLEELFLQVTAPDPWPAVTDAVETVGAGAGGAGRSSEASR